MRRRLVIRLAPLLLVLGLWVDSLSSGIGSAAAAVPGLEECARPAIGSIVPEPRDLRSINGVLRLDLTIRNIREANGEVRYCYLLPDGTRSPVLRVSPGDELILNLHNDLEDLESSAPASRRHSTPSTATRRVDPCTSGAMTPTSTNLHFHGLTVPPRCHEDEVIKTSIQPDDPPFEYHFRIPRNEPPGLNWYHPHIHGFTTKQVMGGASGALIVEGLERAVPEVAGLPERVFVIRDQALINPDAPPSAAEPVVPKPVFDSDGDITNNNTGFGTPSRDLSINFVPVPYPDYPPAKILLKPGERQLWRVLNSCAVTYLHLALLYDKVPQMLSVVAIDGVPINRGGPDASIKALDHIALPPGSRVEFIVTGPPLGTSGLLITRTVNTGQDGENDPNRAIASVVAEETAPEPGSRLPATAKPLPDASLPWVGSVTPVRERKLYFSERRADPKDPNSQILFFITVDGETPKLFDPASNVPDIVVKQGDVEDWVIENRSLELHAFHVHQLHFQLIDWYGIKIDEPFLRDTVSVPYFDNHMTRYPSVRIRMDFRDPNTVGTFVYHCHLLEHEDGGMMGTIRVDPADAPPGVRAVAAGKTIN
jgi:FtsP/CotA-like multicopper oxidase with cupredoxin domain